MKEFKTSDLPFAAYLYFKGYRLRCTEPTNIGTRHSFVFDVDDLERILEAQEDYRTGQDLVSAQHYWRALKSVRKRLPYREQQ